MMSTRASGAHDLPDVILSLVWRQGVKDDLGYIRLCGTVTED